MKKTLTVMAICALLTGCATPLDVAKDASRISASLNLSPEAVKFTSYCIFDEARKWPRPRFGWNEGAVVLTDDLLIITSDKFTKQSGRQKIEVKISDMDSVAEAKFGLGHQLQITHGDFLIVIQITANKMFGSGDGSRKLLDMISGKGVPVIASDKFHELKFDTPMIIPFFNFGT